VRNKTLAAFAVISLLLCFFRNNGIYMVFPAGLVIIFVLRGKANRLKMAGAVAAVLAFYVVWNAAVLPAIGVAPGSSREAMSIPLQQTARFVVEHPDEITQEEREIIDRVMDYGQLPGLYDPQLSDPVKFSRGATPDGEYFKLWWKMLLRHPGTYIQATLHGCYGYFYPFENTYSQGGYYTWMQGPPVATGDLDIHFTNSPEIIEKMGDYSERWRELPVLGLTSSAGAHAWILLVLTALLLRKKRFAELSVMVLPLLNIAVCVASPVNGLLRYAMPVIACIPFLAAFCVRSLRRSPSQEM
jgi:hypothetical protein